MIDFGPCNGRPPTSERTTQTNKPQSRSTTAFEFEAVPLKDSFKLTSARTNKTGPPMGAGRLLWADTDELRKALPRERWYGTWAGIVDAVLSRYGCENDAFFRQWLVPLRFESLVSALPEVPTLRKYMAPRTASWDDSKEPQVCAQAFTQLALLMCQDCARRAFIATLVVGLSVDEYAAIEGKSTEAVALHADYVLGHIATFAFGLEVA